MASSSSAPILVDGLPNRNSEGPTPFKNVIQSDLYVYYIGPKKTKFVVHSAAITNLAVSLHNMHHEGMKETHAKVVEIEDIDEDTFSRVCQFAYTGDYYPPSFETDKDDTGVEKVESGVSGINDDSLLKEDYDDFPPPAEAPDDGPTPADDDNSWGQSTRKKNLKKRSKKTSDFGWAIGGTKKTQLRKAFGAREYPTLVSDHVMIDAYEPVANENPRENYTAVFLGHAYLYVFADKYDVTPMKLLALQKLHQTLLTFKLYERRIGDVLELVRFTCSEKTMDREGGELRALVLHYVVYVLGTISDTDEFYGLLEEGGPFVRDFWRMIKHDVL